MLKIFFSSDDIARTRLAPTADPLWEVVLSLHLLQRRGRDPLTAGWRRTVSQRIRRDAARDDFRMLFALNPPYGYFPDFQTPYASRQGWDAGLDALRSTPTSRLRRDLTVLADAGTVPHGAESLAQGDRDVLGRLADAMQRYRSLALGPYWTQIELAVEADRSRRARAYLDGGAESLLHSLRPGMRWENGVLEVLDYPSSRELHLDGRGLLLVPSFFCSRTPVTLFDPGLPPVLVYPVNRLGGLADTDGAGGIGQEALGALIGRTRAAVLEVADTGGCTTTEIARRLQISPAAASQHATVLRNAGLLVSQRDRNSVLHSLTPLGRAVLNR